LIPNSKQTIVSKTSKKRIMEIYNPNLNRARASTIRNAWVVKNFLALMLGAWTQCSCWTAATTTSLKVLSRSFDALQTLVVFLDFVFSSQIPVEDALASQCTYSTLDSLYSYQRNGS
jgi:hypothetical protein